MNYKEFIKKYDLTSELKTDELAVLRQYFMYLMRSKTLLSLQAIGKELNRHHSTIIYGIKVVNNHIRMKDKYLTKVLSKYENDLNAINWEL